MSTTRRTAATMFFAALAVCAQPQIRLCKTVSGGAPSGAYNFSVNNVPILVMSGACASLEAPVGTVLTVREVNIPAGTSVTSIASTGAPLTSQSLATATATLTVGSSPIVLTFNNALTSSLARLEVCKVAGAGLDDSTTFHFSVMGGGVSETLHINPGSCSSVGLPAGMTVLVHEQSSETAALAGISGGYSPNLVSATVAATLGAAGSTTRVSFTNKALGTEGCGPGYFKHHLSSALANTKVGAYFHPLPSILANQTLAEALEGHGGNGVDGGRRILLRAAVTALLNAINPNVRFSLTAGQVISIVNTALASNDRQTMLRAADRFEEAYSSGSCSASDDDEDEDDDEEEKGKGKGKK